MTCPRALRRPMRHVVTCALPLLPGAAAEPLDPPRFDLVLPGRDGVVARRVAADVDPLPANPVFRATAASQCRQARRAASIGMTFPGGRSSRRRICTASSSCLYGLARRGTLGASPSGRSA